MLEIVVAGNGREQEKLASMQLMVMTHCLRLSDLRPTHFLSQSLMAQAKMQKEIQSVLLTVTTLRRLV